MVLPSSWKLMVPTTGFLQRGVQFGIVQHIAGFQVFHAATRDSQINVFIDTQRSAIAVAKPGRFGRELFPGFQRIDGFEEAEAPGQQLLLSDSRPL